jgi:hypothetical protein
VALTLADARRRFGNIVGANRSFTDALNEVQQRLITEGNWKGNKVNLRFAVYVNARGDHIVTMPLWVENILGGAYEPRCSQTVPDNNFHDWGGLPIPVRNGWFEFSESGPGNMIGTNPTAGIIKQEGRFTTFADWNTAMKLRVKPERDESPGGKIIFRGTLSGERVYSQDPDSGVWVEGIVLPFTDTTIVTTTLTIDEPPYQVIKPVTKGRLRLYAVDTDNNETLVADYYPNERNPSYARYKVPNASTTT